jgi:hypothetical protein
MMRRLKVLCFQGLVLAALRLLTQLSTECVRNLDGSSGADFVEILPHKHKKIAALFLCRLKFSFEIKVLALSQMYCAQSYPQNMCRTGLAAMLPTRYIAAFAVPVVSLAGFFSGVCFARHFSSCRLADLVFADRLDHRACAHH